MANSPLLMKVQHGIEKKIIYLCFDKSADEVLRVVLTQDTSCFVETDSATADLIIFGSDDINYIKNSPLYCAYKAKSICISENDIPTFRLPGLYASNETSYITKRRTRTINYFIHATNKSNEELDRLAGQMVEKKYLYSFIGSSNSWARKWIFKYLETGNDTIIEATDSFNPNAILQNDVKAAKAVQTPRYAQVMAASKFTLCPRGCGLSSYRLFESMALGVAPVVISDSWRPIDGIDWNFALFLPERHISQADRIIRSHEPEWEERGRMARSVYTALLDKASITNTLHQQIVDLISDLDPRKEAIMAILARFRVAQREVYWAAYGWLKFAILKGFHASGVPLPIRLHQPLEVLVNRQKRP